jgi:TP901 family phage tail tape measure protein
MSEGIKLQIDPQAIKEITQAAADISETLRREFEIAGKNVSQQINFMGKAIRQTEADIRKHTETIRHLNQQLGVLSKQKRMNSNEAKDLRLQLENEWKERKKLISSYAESKKFLEELVYVRKQEMVQAKEGVGVLGEMGKGFQGVLKYANQFAGVFGFGFGLYGVLRLFRSSIETIRDFENAQKQLAAVTGATQREMDIFARQAVQVGSTSVYGAKGVSELQVQLAKMGFSIREIGNMTQAIVNLATATQEDLGKSAETVANVIRAYNMDARETTRVTDVMAKSFTSSALDMEKFRQSIKYIAPIANQANFSIEETAALLGKLADAGISGSLAGTSLRNIISQLSDSTSNLNKKVGMTVNGFDDFVEALWELNRQGVDLEDVFGIMDRRAASAFTLILRSAESLEEFRKALQESGGAADRMARIQLESLTNKTKLARNAWQGFVLSLDKGEGALSRTMKAGLDVFTDAVSRATFEMNRQSVVAEREKNRLNALANIVNDVSISMDRRIEAMRRLKTEYPEYFKNVEDDIEGLGAFNDAVEEVNENLETTIEFRRAQEKVEELERAYEKARNRLDGYSISAQKHNELVKEYLRIWREEGELDVGMWPQIIAGLAAGSWRQFIIDMTDAGKTVQDFGEEMRNALDEVDAQLWEQPTATIIAHLDATGRAASRVKHETDKFTKEVERLKKDGVPPIEAIEQAYKSVGKALEQTIKNRKEFYNVSARARVETELLKRAAGELADEYQEMLAEARKLVKENKDQAQYDFKMEELRARKRYEGLVLEEKLIDIRYRLAVKLAEIEGGTAGARMQNIAALERQIALQELRARLIREEYDLNSRSIQQAIALRKVFEEIYGLDIERKAIFTSADDLDGQLELEIRKIKAHNGRILQEIEDAERQRTAQVKMQWDSRIAQTEKGTEQRADLERRKEEELLAIEQEFAGKRIAERMRNELATLQMSQQFAQRRIDLMRRESDERLRAFQMQQDKERIMFESSWQGDRARREFEKQRHQEWLKEQAKELQVIIKRIEAERALLRAKGLPTPDLDIALGQMRLEYDNLIAEINNPKFDMTEWNLMRDTLKGVLNDITTAIQKNIQERENMLRRERELRDRDVQHLQQALELELKLREQGFRSNVEGKQRELAEMEKLQRRAEQQEADAIRRRQIAESIVQSMNILTSAAQIIKHETLKGPVGLITAGGAIASLFAIWAGVRGRAATATRYTHGGHFLLDGPSHAGGGVALARGHEAQGGEGVSVWNRQATRKHWPAIKSITDAINKGKPLMPSVSVYAGNKDLSAIRRLLEDSEHYEGGYRIKKHGNHTIRCRLN